MTAAFKGYGIGAVTILLTVALELATLRFYDDRDPPPYVVLLAIQVVGFVLAVRALRLRSYWAALLAIPYLIVMFAITFQVGYQWGLYDYP
jgi:uncharacterized protein (DUF983 family)